MGRPRRDGGMERFGLLWALGISIAAHLVLFLLSLWFPLSTHSAALFDEIVPEESITFSFDREEATTEDPLEDAQFLPIDPETAQQAPPPLTQPAEPPPLEPAEPPPPIEPIEGPREEATTEETQETQPPRQEPVDSGPKPPRELNVREALRDFHEALTARPPAPSRSRGNDSAGTIVMPDLSQIPFSGFGMGNLLFESGDFDWNDYGRQIYMIIWRAWHNRLWMTTDDFEKWAHQTGQWYLHHQTQVRFVIERNGQVSDIAQEAGSGCPALDDSAIDALAEVILPPLPANFPRAREVVHVRFLADGPIRGLRPTLSRYKSMGLF